MEMAKYNLILEIDEQEVDAVFQRLAKAMEEIQQCYYELNRINAIKFKRERPLPEETGEKAIQK